MKLAILGLGLMGLPIATRLQLSGFDIRGWNRGDERRQLAGDQGIAVEADLATVVTEADLLLLVLSDASAIESALLNSNISPLLKGKTVLQMGTIAPAESRRLAGQIVEFGGNYLEAPVLGSIPEARNGELIIMAGGSEETFQHCLPLLKALGSAPQRVGLVGQGAALKLAMNQLIASLTAGFSLSLGLVRREGLDIEQFMSLLRESALYAPTFDKKLGKMLNHDYSNPNFPLKHLLKDVDLFRHVAQETGMEASLPRAMQTLLESGIENDLAELDYSSLYEVINPDPN
ncbi:MAG: NAD(P)-dependent oxidoreductase [Gammaproteobacteria bacterium]|nr:NAD(P)-dependent oxidoreductase [Gammaproteobacteria bacterium]